MHACTLQFAYNYIIDSMSWRLPTVVGIYVFPVWHQVCQVIQWPYVESWENNAMWFYASLMSSVQDPM